MHRKYTEFYAIKFNQNYWEIIQSRVFLEQKSFITNFQFRDLSLGRTTCHKMTNRKIDNFVKAKPMNLPFNTESGRYVYEVLSVGGHFDYTIAFIAYANAHGSDTFIRRF